MKLALLLCGALIAFGQVLAKPSEPNLPANNVQLTPNNNSTEDGDYPPIQLVQQNRGYPPIQLAQKNQGSSDDEKRDLDQQLYNILSRRLDDGKLEKRSNVLGQEVSLTENTPQRAQELLQAQQAQASEDIALAPRASCMSVDYTSGSLRIRNYGNRQRLCFIITNPQQLLLTWDDDFDLEYHSRCRYDWVKIYESYSSSTGRGSYVGKYCGQNPPGSQTIQGPMYVYFRTDGSQTGRGFELFWSSSSGSPSPTPTPQPLRTTTTTTTVAPPPSNVPDVDVSCGRSAFGSPRIIGGQEATRGQWPWQLMLYNSAGYRCGATIVAEGWAITAAHCVTDSSGRTSAAGDITLIAGLHDRSSPDSSRVYHYVSNVIRHGSYTGDPADSFHHDIALLEVSNTFTYNDYVKPACLKQAGVTSGETCWTSGWGSTVGDNPNPAGNDRYLQQVELDAISTYDCPYAGMGSGHLCAHGTNKGVCQGDSGGPFVCENGGRFYLQGVTSFSGVPCASTPSGYARVSTYINWIIQNSNGEISVTSS